MRVRGMTVMMPEDDDEAPPSRPDMRAQRLELLARFARYQEAHGFEPGDLVAEKDGLGMLHSDGGGIALIFWRPLDPADAVDAAIIRDAARNREQGANCFVGALVGDAATVMLTTHDTRRLRPLTAEERAELDAVRGGEAETAGQGE